MNKLGGPIITDGAGGLRAEGEKYADMKDVARTSTGVGATRPSINLSPEERI